MLLTFTRHLESRLIRIVIFGWSSRYHKIWLHTLIKIVVKLKMVKWFIWIKVLSILKQIFPANIRRPKWQLIFGQNLDFLVIVPSLALLWKLRGEKSGFGTLGTLSVDSYGRRFGLSPSARTTPRQHWATAVSSAGCNPPRGTRRQRRQRERRR